jgi:CxxC motif-containing protein (DUF1111 family)/predicted lipoprotein with Yx(FWY)xxD motif
MYKIKKIILLTFSALAINGFAVNANSPNSWDVDDNGVADALTDGLLILRHGFGLSGNSLTDNAIATNSPLTASEVEAKIASSLAIADIDGDGQVDALTDGLLLLRYLFNLSGDGLVDSAVATGALRSSHADITQYIESYLPDGSVVDNNSDNSNNSTPTDDHADDDHSDEDHAGGGNNSASQSNYCVTPLYHLNMAAEASTAIALTIENVGNNQLRVLIISGDSDAVDYLGVESSTGASVTDDVALNSGELAKILSWSGSPPDSASFNILWSKENSGANWIVRNLVVPTDAVCTGVVSPITGNDTDIDSNPISTDNPAPLPSELDSDVLSIFSDSYTDISGVNFDPDWGQVTTVSVSNGELNYQNLNYQGTTLGGPQDVSGYDYFHIDIFPQSSDSLQLFLINSDTVTGYGPIEIYFELDPVINQWNSFTIPLSAFSSLVDLTKVDELKIIGSGNVTFDNLYFGGVSAIQDTDSDVGDDLYSGNDVIPTEEIAVANGILVGGVNSSKPQFVVYVFDSDPISGDVSNCYGECATQWPPVYVTDEAASGVSNLGSITRSDGTVQATYEGRPLYFFVGDEQAGERSGNNVSGWHSVEYGNIGPINKLYNDSTALEPMTTFTRDNGVVVTRLADRGRDRHAKDSSDADHYDHYLAHYWQFRTMRIQLEDFVPTGESLIKVTWITEAALGAKEFRVWYSGASTTGQFWFNPQPVGEQANPNEQGVHYHGSGTWNNDFVKTSSEGGQHKYTLNIISRWQRGGQIQETLAVDMPMEFEASMFLLDPPAGTRLNYYGTSFVYVIGEEGVRPFEWQAGQQDGTPIPQKGLSGGNTTLGYNYTNEPAGRFMQMATNMSPGNAEPFVRGRRVHHTSFVDGVHGERHDNPAWTQQAGKAGTHYINESCAGCHVRNGRALVADVGDSLDRWVFKVGDENGDPLSAIGSVLQPTKIGGGSSEGTVKLGQWTDHDNGLRSPNYQFSMGTPPQFSARIAPSLVGMGLLEAIEESTIISWVDEDDADNNGISGRASIVEDPLSGVMRLGRFGYKAGTFSVKHQVASAFNTDMGVMTSMIPNPDCGSEQTNCGNSVAELDDQHVDDLVKYVSLLGVGARRDYNNQSGEALFQSIGCAGCHRPSMVTSNNHPLAELRGQTIYPYTDLLLHDMGSGLADNLAEGSASGSEWRTAPLWGLGLTKNVMLGDAKGNDSVSLARDYPNDLNRIGYLHDGRARTIDEAILWHGGEALSAKNAYESLLSTERTAVIDFLKSL